MAPAPRSNVTGFDLQAFRQSAGIPKKDPWAKAEIWRSTGPFSRYNRLKGALPGLGTATVAFAAYCTYEYLFLNKDEHGHGHGHGDAKHGEEHH